MKLKILFFGVLGEVTGKKEHELNSTKIKKISDLVSYYEQIHPTLNKYKYSISLNKLIVTDDLVLKDNDEIALLPPFAGG